MGIQKIIQIIKNKSTGLSEENLIRFEKEINWHFPTEYREIIKTVDGGYGEINNSYIDFWCINDIGLYIDEVTDSDELLLFASDGCGIAFAFDKRSNEVLSLPMDCLERSYAKIIANSFSDFIEKIESHKLDY